MCYKKTMFCVSFVVVLTFFATTSREGFGVVKKSRSGRHSTVRRSGTISRQGRINKLHKEVTSEISKARKYLDKNHYRQAIKTLNKAEPQAQQWLGLVQCWIPDSKFPQQKQYQADMLYVCKQSQADIKKMFESIDAEGTKQLKQAGDDYNDKKYEQALKAYSRISLTFDTREASQKARDALDEAKDDSDVAVALKKAEAEDFDERINATIVANLPPDDSNGKNSAASFTPAKRIRFIKKLSLNDRVKIMEMLKALAEKYSEYPVGETAAADLEKLQADKRMQTQISASQSGKKLKRTYKLAQSYDKAGMAETALAYYKQVLTIAPKSPQAKKARKRIANLEERKALNELKEVFEDEDGF